MQLLNCFGVCSGNDSIFVHSGDTKPKNIGVLGENGAFLGPVYVTFYGYQAFAAGFTEEIIQKSSISR